MPTGERAEATAILAVRLVEAERGRVFQLREAIPAGHALGRGKPSAPFAAYKARGMLRGRVLDYGAGREQHGYAKFDPIHHPDRRVLTAGTYDTVMLNYVLNVIPSTAGRQRVLASIQRVLKPGGRLLAAVNIGGGHARVTRGPNSAAGWRAFFEAAGWKAERISGVSFPGWVLKR